MKNGKRGRPAGARTVDRPAADVLPSSCPKCGSTNREPYSGQPREFKYAGEHEGRPYTRIVYRSTRCRDCGQARVDREWLYEPEK
jgi:predicted Zn-ribbon and HTH transcriptional regulator